LDTADPPLDDDGILRHIRANLSNPAQLDKYMDRYLSYALVYLKQPQKVTIAKQILELLDNRCFYYLQRSRYHNLSLPRLMERIISDALQAEDKVLPGFFAEWLASYYLLNGYERSETESLLWTIKTAIDTRRANDDALPVSDEIRFWLNYHGTEISNGLLENVYPYPYQQLEEYATRDAVSPLESIRIQLSLAVEELVGGKSIQAGLRLIEIKNRLGDVQLASWGIHPNDVMIRRYQHYTNLLSSIGSLQRGNYEHAQHCLAHLPQAEAGHKFIEHDLRILFNLQQACLLQAQGEFDEALHYVAEAQGYAEKQQHHTLLLYTYYTLASILIDHEQADVADVILNDLYIERLKRGAIRNDWYATHLFYALAYTTSHNNKHILAKQYLAQASKCHAKLKPSPYCQKLGDMLKQSHQDLENKQPLQAKPLTPVPPVVVI